MAITVETRTDIVRLVVGMFGAAPGASVLAELSDIVNGGETLRALTVNLANSAEFKASYPSFLTNTEFATNYLNTVLGGVSAANFQIAVDAVVALLNAGQSRGSVVYDIITAIKGVAETDANFGVAAASLNNKTEVAVYYSVDKNLSASTLAELQNVIGNVTSDDATVVTAKASVDGTSSVGTTYTLTTNIDTILGTKNDDTFNATQATYTGFDNIDGGLGNDTINITNVGGAFPTLTTATVKNVETAVLQSSLGAVTADVSGWTGLTTLTVLDVAAAPAAMAVTTKSNVTKATLSGGTTQTITDSGGTGADTLATVSLSGATGAMSVVSDKLTSLTLTSTTTAATVTAAAGTRALGLTVNGVTGAGSVITDGEATTVNVSSAGATSSGITLTAVKATAVTINAEATLTLADVNLTAAKTLTVSGSKGATITATSDVTALTTIDTTASTGGLTVAAALGNAVTFTGGAGKDSITVGATTKTITMGGGDDTVVVTAAALGTGGTIDAGDGTDTLSMTAANAATATATTTFATKISGFEKVTLTAPGTDTINLANLDSINYVSTAGATAMTLNGMVTGGTLRLTAAGTAYTVNHTSAATLATDDVFNIIVTANAAGVAAGTVTVANVETVNITSDDSATSPAGIQHSMTLTAANATTLNVSGDAGIALTLTGSTALATINTSGVTKGAVSLTTVADVATTFVGGATATTVSLAGITSSTKAGSITTGAGNDTITGGAGADTINAGDGTNSINGGAGNDIITGGAGVDTITGGLGADTLTGGGGADIFTYTAANESNGVNVDTITDFVTKVDKLAINTTGDGSGAVFLGVAAGYGAVLTALSGAGTANGGEAVLDSTTGTLYIDINVDGKLDANDMAIQLTGVTTLAAADFIWS